MSMRLRVEFAKPLSAEQRRNAALALACLGKVRRLHVERTGWVGHVWGEGVGTASVRAALVEAGIGVLGVRTTLASDEDARCEDAGPAAGEKLRPAGR